MLFFSPLVPAVIVEVENLLPGGGGHVITCDCEPPPVPPRELWSYRYFYGGEGWQGILAGTGGMIERERERERERESLNRGRGHEWKQKKLDQEGWRGGPTKN